MRVFQTACRDECCPRTGRTRSTADQVHWSPTFTSSVFVRAFAIVFQKIPGFVSDFCE